MVACWFSFAGEVLCETASSGRPSQTALGLPGMNGQAPQCVALRVAKASATTISYVHRSYVVSVLSLWGCSGEEEGRRTCRGARCASLPFPSPSLACPSLRLPFAFPSRPFPPLPFSAFLLPSLSPAVFSFGCHPCSAQHMHTPPFPGARVAQLTLTRGPCESKGAWGVRRLCVGRRRNATNNWYGSFLNVIQGCSRPGWFPGVGPRVVS